MNEDLIRQLRIVSGMLTDLADKLAGENPNKKDPELEPDQMNELINFCRGREWVTTEEVRKHLNIENNDVGSRLVGVGLRRLNFMPKSRRFGKEVKRMWRRLRPV